MVSKHRRKWFPVEGMIVHLTICSDRLLVPVASLIYPDGVFEAVMKVKKMPYLDHEGGHRRYDAIEVGDILANCALEAVSPRMKAIDLAQLLEKSCHNGFPVVGENMQYLGLVRRDQIAALLECGVFNKSIGEKSTSAWTRPESGLEKTPLMRKSLSRLQILGLVFYELQLTFCVFSGMQAGLTTLMTTGMIIFFKRDCRRRRKPLRGLKGHHDSV